MQKVPFLYWMYIRLGSFKSWSDRGIWFLADRVSIQQSFINSFNMLSGFKLTIKKGEMADFGARKKRAKIFFRVFQFILRFLIIWTWFFDTKHPYDIKNPVKTKYGDKAKQNPEESDIWYMRNIPDDRWNPQAQTNVHGWLFGCWSQPRQPCGPPQADHPHRPESHQWTPSYLYGVQRMSLQRRKKIPHQTVLKLWIFFSTANNLSFR